MNIGQYCKQYRVKKLRTVRDISNDKVNFSTLYSFENGQSNNFHHVELYIQFALSINDIDNFMSGLIKEIQHNG